MALLCANETRVDWVQPWCSSPRPAAALAACVEPGVLSLLVRKALPPDSAASAVSALGALLGLACVRQRMPELAEVLVGLMRLGSQPGAAGSASAAALVTLLGSAAGPEIVAAVCQPGMHLQALASPHIASVVTALASLGAPGLAVLMHPWPDVRENALCVLAQQIADACWQDCAAAAAALELHNPTLLAAAWDERAVQACLLPLLPGALTHAAGAGCTAAGHLLSAFAHTPCGCAALEATPGAVTASATALTSLAGRDPIGAGMAWRDVRAAASALGATPSGARALHSAGLSAPLADSGAACEDAESAALVTACAARLFHLLAANVPETLIAFRRDGIACAALHRRWVGPGGLFRTEAWPDCAAFCSLTGDAALLSYPASLLLGPLRGEAPRLLAIHGDATGGAGVLPNLLDASAIASGFTTLHMQDFK